MSVLSSFRIEGRTALVTGSSRGIGRAIALALAEAGADVVVHSGGEVAEAESVASEIRRLGRRAAVVTADLGESTAVDVIADACATLAPVLDILVLNAAVQIRKSWTTIELEDATTQIQVNLLSSLALMQTFVPSMATRGWGRALIIGSIQERKPHPEMAVYAASKGALANLAQNLAKQVAGRGVTINTLSPGVILTERNSQVLADVDYRESVLSNIPAGRLGQPADCAAAALLLCSDAGSYITGANLPVDGGGRLV